VSASPRNLPTPQATDLDFLLEQARRQIAAGQVYDLDEWLDDDGKW